MDFTYEALKEVFDVLAACKNRTPDGYLLDSISVLPFGNLQGKRGMDIKARIAKLAELGLIECYEFNVQEVEYTKGMKRVPLIRLLYDDFAVGWTKVEQ